MSFREKSVWIQFLSVLLVFGGYYLSTHLALIPRSGPEHFHVLLGCIGLVILLQIVFHILVAIQNPQDARSPQDERERAIEHRAHTYGYYVLLIGVLGLFYLGHSYRDVPELLHWAFFAVIAATLTITLTQIVLFRRSA